LLLNATVARCWGLLAAVLIAAVSGCSAIHQPYAQTIEHKMEVLNRMPKSELKPIDLRLLSQVQPPEHLVDDGDILGIYIEGGTNSGDSMPVRFPDDRLVSPAIGYPIPVRNGGYIRVPQLGVLHVRGMTIWQIEERIRHILTVERKTHQADKTQIHVSLMWKHGVNVMVVRQEELGTTKLVSPSNGTDPDRRSGQVVELPAFRNDVLNALLETGGLPNDQAENAVYIFKRNDPRLAANGNRPLQMPPQQFASAQTFPPPNAIQQAAYSEIAGSPAPLPPSSPVNSARRYPRYGAQAATSSLSGVTQTAYPPLTTGGHTQPMAATMTNASHHSAAHAPPLYTPQPASLSPCPTCPSDSRHPNAIRIPLAVPEGELIQFSQNDVILEDGDIVLVESREDDHFFTAGLLGGGQYELPRQQDIDVLDAVLLAGTYSQSTQLNAPTRSIGGVSVLNRDVTVGASRVVIERKTPDGGTQRFRVSLYRAMRDPNQRVIIEPGDRLYLEYTPIEACLAFFERHLLDPFLTGSPALLN